MERRSFLKGLVSIIGGTVLASGLDIAASEKLKSEIENEFAFHSVDKQSLPPLGDAFRWIQKDRVEDRYEKGYRFVGTRPITTGDLILMKKGDSYRKEN